MVGVVRICWLRVGDELLELALQVRVSELGIVRSVLILEALIRVENAALCEVVAGSRVKEKALKRGAFSPHAWGSLHQHHTTGNNNQSAPSKFAIFTERPAASPQVLTFHACLKGFFKKFVQQSVNARGFFSET